MSSLLCLDLFYNNYILSASTLSGIVTFMLTIISKWKWSSTLKVTVSGGARAGRLRLTTRTLARTGTYVRAQVQQISTYIIHIRVCGEKHRGNGYERKIRDAAWEVI